MTLDYARVAIIVPCKEVSGLLFENLTVIKHGLVRDKICIKVVIIPDIVNKEDLENIRKYQEDTLEIILSPCKSGPAEKRNVGASIVKEWAEYYAFIDDDAYPDRLWLVNALKNFQNDNIIAAVTGPNITPPYVSARELASGAILESWLGSFKIRYRYTKIKKKFYVDDVASVNLIVKACDFWKVGGFRTHFWPGEDTVFALDITYRLGKKILYDPSVIVYHHRKPLFKKHLQQIYRYGYYRGLFTRLFPETSRRPIYYLPSLGIISTAVLFLASFLFNNFLILFFPMMTYISIDLVESIRLSIKYKCIKLIPFLLLGFPLTHISYAIGFIRGRLHSIKKSVVKLT